MTYLSHSKTQKPISYSKSRIETLGNHVKYPVRNQECFRVREFSWSQGTSFIIHLKHKKERFRREIRLFLQETLKNLYLNDKL